MTLPGGALMPHLSARRRHEICDTVFEMLGGVERLHHEANRDREAYWDFMKLWSKGLPRAVATEHSVSENSVEAMLEKLDRAQNAKTINGTAQDITDIEPDEAA
jgi:hypothetical protein